MLAALKNLPRDAELLAFEAGWRWICFASTPGWVGGGALQEPVELAGNSALEAAADLALALALGDAAAGVGAGRSSSD